MLLREIFIGGARAPPAPPHATALRVRQSERVPKKVILLPAHSLTPKRSHISVTEFFFVQLRN